MLCGPKSFVSGTYVKELVHGDFDRTRPSLSTILDCDTDILALDVEEASLCAACKIMFILKYFLSQVFLDWPPGSQS